jgi:tight adherence protein B
MALGVAAVGAIAVGASAFLLIGPSTRVVDVVGDRRPVSSARARSARARSVWSWRGRQRRGSLEQAFAHDLRALVAELRSGAHPGKALSTAASSTVLWPQAVAAERFGDGVADGFARDATENPRLGRYLRQLSACWRVGVNHGSGLAISIERLAVSIETTMDVEATLANELAAPRATVRLLAFLPVVGIAMGYMLGANPLAWFVDTGIGKVTFLAAGGLTIAGSWWSHRIVSRIEAGVR